MEEVGRREMKMKRKKKEKERRSVSSSRGRVRQTGFEQLLAREGKFGAQHEDERVEARRLAKKLLGKRKKRSGGGDGGRGGGGGDALSVRDVFGGDDDGILGLLGDIADEREGNSDIESDEDVIGEEGESSEDEFGDADDGGQLSASASEEDDDDDEEEDEEEYDERDEEYDEEKWIDTNGDGDMPTNGTNAKIGTALQGAYVPPQRRNEAAAAADDNKNVANGTNSGAGNDNGSSKRDAETATLRQSRAARSVRGVMNRISEGTVPAMTRLLADLARELGRRDVSACVVDEIVSSCSKGPRATEAFCGTAAALIAGLACTIGQEIGARCAAEAAQTLENAMDTHDTLSCRNVVMFLVRLMEVDILREDALFGLLQSLCAETRDREVTDTSVAVIAALMRHGGALLRSKNPESMRTFVIDVHRCVGETRNAAAADASGPQVLNAAKTDLMLSLVQDVKNNKLRNKGSTMPLSNATTKWLRELDVRSKASLLGVTWKVLLKEDKRGLWWVPGATDNRLGGRSAMQTHAGTRNGAHASTSNAATSSALGTEADAMLELAGKQRFVGVQKTLFCAIMGARDVIDAFEKIMRLGLKGSQEREILRVLIECCMREKAYNNFYALLAERVCGESRQMRFTLQLVVWDHFQELDDMDARRISNLARFASSMIRHEALSLGVLKPLDAMLSGKQQARDGKSAARAILFARIMLIDIIDALADEEDVTKLVYPPTKATVSVASTLYVFIKSRVLAQVRGDTERKFRVLMASLQRCRKSSR